MGCQPNRLLGLSVQRSEFSGVGIRLRWVCAVLTGNDELIPFYMLLMFNEKVVAIVVYWAWRKMGNLNAGLSKKTILGLKVWELIAILVGLFIVTIIALVPLCLTSRKKARRSSDKLPFSQIPTVSKEIKEVRVEQVPINEFHDGKILTIGEKFSDVESDKVLVHDDLGKMKNVDTSGQSGSFHHLDGAGSQSGEEGSSGTHGVYKPPSLHPVTSPSPLSGLPEFSHLGWGHWFTLRDLEIATDRFSKENVLGEGGYGVVYRGRLINGTPVAVKKILNNL
ncbi:hypothetical protein Ancab_000516 [Ancistrocladus abbreviatus]